VCVHVCVRVVFSKIFSHHMIVPKLRTNFSIMVTLSELKKVSALVLLLSIYYPIDTGQYHVSVGLVFT